MDGGREGPRPATVRRLEQAIGPLARQVVAELERDLPWYRAMSAQERSWLGLVAQAGIAAFVAWYRVGQNGAVTTAEVFGTAPRELVRSVSLAQTVELVRRIVELVESRVEDVVDAGEVTAVREAVLRYSREIAFAAAGLYAHAAEERGAWDARLEALVVDALLRGDAGDGVRSRAAALGWSDTDRVVVVVGHPPDEDSEVVAEAVRRAAHAAGADVLTGVQSDRLVAVVGLRGDDADVPAAVRAVSGQFGPGPVVVGGVAPDLASATGSATAALAGLAAAPGWPDAPRPVPAVELLPERALDGDASARDQLIRELYAPLLAAGPPVLETVAAFLENGGSVETTARLLFIHPNTVRYRLRRVTDISGYSPTEARDSYLLRVALTLGRLAATD